MNLSQPTHTTFYNTLLGVAVWFWALASFTAVPVLRATSAAKAPAIDRWRWRGPLFLCCMVGVLVGLDYVPALAR
jgi:hypothetical protein